MLIEDEPSLGGKAALVRFADATALGQTFGPLLQHVTALLTGHISPDVPAWTRLQEAQARLMSTDLYPETAALHAACATALIAAGVDPAWMAADYDNIDELLWGELGPAP